MKLYKRFSRFAYRKMVSHRFDKILRWGLSLKPGDLINDCSGFNKVIRTVEPDYRYSSRGWAIIGIDFSTEPHGGGCSLTHCGVEPAIPRNVLEAKYVKDYSTEESLDWFRHWFQGSPEKAEEAIGIVNKRVEAIKSGGHFLDERGIMTPEFGHSSYNG